MSAPHESDTDVVDRAAGLAAGDPLHRARRFRVTVVEATQASHDALLDRARRSPRIWNASTSSSSRLPSLVTVAIASRC
jgi:hypothetical protein